jgi:hypothetical protein
MDVLFSQLGEEQWGGLLLTSSCFCVTMFLTTLSGKHFLFLTLDLLGKAAS